MNNWRDITLGEVAEINMGQSPKSVYYNEIGQGTKFLQGNRTFGRFYPSYDTYTTKITKLVEKGDILFTVRAPVGDINIANDNICIGRGIAGIRSKEHQEFLYYSLLYHNSSLKTAENGTTYGSINKTDLNKFKFKIPNIETQEKIAKVLSRYDKLIENNNRRIEVLEETAEEVYKEWFVRMRFPGYENTKFVKGIPEGWEVKKIGDIFNVSSSKRVYSSDYVESGIPFYRSKEVIKLSNGEAVSELLYISDNKYKEFKNKFGVPQKHDILITSVGTIGIPLLITDDNPFYFKDGNLTWIQSSLNPVISFYLYYWLKSDIGYRSLQMYTIGTSQSALTITNLKKLKILLPNETVLHKFNEFFKDLNMKNKYLNQKNQNLKKQRNLLLPRLMNGSIKVK